MNLHGRLILAATLIPAMLGWHGSAAQGCQNTAQFPGTAVQGPTGPTPVQASTCIYLSEYTVWTGILADGNYQFVCTDNGNGAAAYITVREGAVGGPILAEGFSPLMVTTTSTVDLYAHYNLNAACATQNSCATNTLALFLDCLPPSATFSIVPDCDNLQYFVEVNLSSIGDAGAVDITNNQGVDPILGVEAGVYQAGPFPNMVPVQITIVHDGDPLCNINSAPLVNAPCPVVSCGPDDYTYCYGNSETTLFTYQGNSTFPLAILFTEGQMESCCDFITIFDGPDASSPILYGPANNGGNMAGVFAASTNPDHHLTVRLTSDGSVNCQMNSYVPLAWTVSCLDCVAPTASTAIVQDCANFQYFVDVDITDLGTDPELEVANNAGLPSTFVTEAGIVQVGPFTSGTPVTITLINDANSLCNVTFSNLVNPLCPMPITCGAIGVEETYCYGPNETSAWSYESDGGGSLKLTFIRGTIESATWDRLYIYDGPDASAPLLFAHIQPDPTSNLGPPGSAILATGITEYHSVDVTATGNNIYMRVESDGSVQCTSSTTYDPWEWRVVCLDCVIPQVTATPVDDCENNQFSIDVDVATTGDGAFVDLVYTVNGGDPETISGVLPGITTIGPFTINDIVNITVLHESSEACTVNINGVTDTNTCPTLILCGTELNEVYCYPNNEDRFFYYQGVGEFPIAILFNAGTMSTFGDFLTIYDGADETAPVLFTGNNGGNLEGLFRVATNVDNRLTVRMQSDAFTSCGTGGFTPMDWTVSCLDCIPPTATFTVVQDCENFQYFVDIDITDLGTDDEIQITNTIGLDPVSVTAPGLVQMGPIVSGTPVSFTLVNDQNSLCNVNSDLIVNPLCPAPVSCPGAPLVETYCYGANDTGEWAYELTGPGTLKLTFIRGTIESATWDRLYIHDGPDANAPILFQHIQPDPTSNLGPEGSAILATGVTNYHAVDVTATGNNLYMRVESDGVIQCQGSTTYDPWEWEVYCINCTAPSVAYNMVPSCEDRTYTAEVIVTDMGGDADLEITNLITDEVQTVSSVGVYTFGPYPVNADSRFEVQNLDYGLCRTVSDTLTVTNLQCVIESCEGTFELCYDNNEDRWFTYQSTSLLPLVITFQQGQMLAGDGITIYNGYDETANLLYNGNNGGNLTGFAMGSQNVNRVLTMRVFSNDAGSCVDGASTQQLRWTVGCGSVGIDEVTGAGFILYPNPTTGLVQIDLVGTTYGKVHLRVMDMSGRVVMEQPFEVLQGALNTIDMSRLQQGNYLVQLITDDWVRTQKVQVAR